MQLNRIYLMKGQEIMVEFEISGGKVYYWFYDNPRVDRVLRKYGYKTSDVLPLEEGLEFIRYLKKRHRWGMDNYIQDPELRDLVNIFVYGETW